MSNIVIRPSLPEDAALAVPLIYSSGPAAFDYVFKTNKFSAQDFLNYAFVRSGGAFSFQNHHSVLLDDKLVGAGAVFTGDQTLGFTYYDAKKIIGFYKWEALGIIKRGLAIEGLIKPPKKPEVSLEHLGIHESERGTGLGTKMIGELMKNPKIKNQKRFVLDVSSENPRAQQLYERLGFALTKTCVSRLNNRFGHVVDHYRMERKIG